MSLSKPKEENSHGTNWKKKLCVYFLYVFCLVGWFGICLIIFKKCTYLTTSLDFLNSLSYETT